MTRISHLFFISLGLIYSFANGIKLIIYPFEEVFVGSDQIITWISPIPLDTTAIDLYRGGLFTQALGNTSKDVYNFIWTVGNDIEGTDFFIKVTGTSDINGSSSDNTPTFLITDIGASVWWISRTAICIIGMIILTWCCICCRKKNHSHDKSPLSTPLAATYPPQYYTSSESSSPSYEQATTHGSSMDNPLAYPCARYTVPTQTYPGQRIQYVEPVSPDEISDATTGVVTGVVVENPTIRPQQKNDTEWEDPNDFYK